MANPSKGPWSDWAGAVQAYALSIQRGESVQQAEAAALKHNPQQGMAEIANAARSAVMAAGALNANEAEMAGIWDSRTILASQPGATELVPTVRVKFRNQNGDVVWRTMQIPLGIAVSLEEAAEQVQEAAIELIEGDDANYPGEYLEHVVVSVIGNLPD